MARCEIRRRDRPYGAPTTGHLRQGARPRCREQALDPRAPVAAGQGRGAGRHALPGLSNDAATLHRLTRHGSALDAADRRRLVAFRPLDPSNRPAPFKRYPTCEPVPLTREFASLGARAADVLSGGPPGVEPPWDEARLARLLFLSNGVSRTSRSAFGDATYFHTAMSAGNLHPVEI